MKNIDWAPVIRIVVRYAVGAMTARGYLGAEAGAALSDPIMLQTISAVLIGLATEIWYQYAKRNGKPT